MTFHVDGLNTFATIVIGLLFCAVATLLFRGQREFGSGSRTSISVDSGERVFDMRREVLWTSIATALLLVIFFAAR